MALFSWAKIDPVITGFPAENSFVELNHWSEEDIIFKISNGLP